MNDWKQYWIHADIVQLREWLTVNYPGEDDYSLPGSFVFACGHYLRPMEESGVDEETGHPLFAAIEGRTDMVWLVCVREDGEAMFEQVKGLPFVFDIFDDMETLKQALPEHCLGQAIPHTT